MCLILAAPFKRFYLRAIPQKPGADTITLITDKINKQTHEQVYQRQI